MIYIPDELIERLGDWEMEDCPIGALREADRSRGGEVTLSQIAAAIGQLKKRAETPYMQNDGTLAEWRPGLDADAIQNVLRDIRDELTQIYIVESAKSIENLRRAVEHLAALVEGED